MENTNLETGTTKQLWKINFDFSDVISKTFGFWWKSLGTAATGWAIFYFVGGIVIGLFAFILGLAFYGVGLFTVDIEDNLYLLTSERGLIDFFGLFFRQDPLGMFLYIIILSFLTFILVSMFSSFIFGALKISSEEDRYPGVSDGWKRFKKYFGRFFVFYIIFAIFFFLIAIPSIILLFIPLIILGVYWSFSIFYYVFDEMPFFQSLGKSYELVKNNWWKVFGISLTLGIIASIGSFIFRLIPFVGFVLSGIFSTISYFASFIIYYSLKEYKKTNPNGTNVE